MLIKERYKPLTVGVNTTVTINSDQIAGFLALTSGTVTVQALDQTGAYSTIINAVAVTAGVYTPMPFFLSPEGGRITTAGGASGVLGI